MKKTFVVIILFLRTLISFADSGLKAGDVVNAWATAGLPLYAKPENTGKKLVTIPYGSSVTIINIDAAAKTFSVSLKNGEPEKPFVIKGQWVKIKYHAYEGYVFSGFLSAMPCFKKTAVGFEEDIVYLDRNYGKPVVTVKKYKTATITTRVYKNRSTEIETQNDGCFDVVLCLTNISYRDAILFEQVMLSADDAADNIKITPLSNNRVKISYDACD